MFRNVLPCPQSVEALEAVSLHILMPWHWGGFYTDCCNQHPSIPVQPLKWQAVTFEVGILWFQYRYEVKYFRVWWYLIINDWDLGRFLNINAGYERWLLKMKLLPSNPVTYCRPLLFYQLFLEKWWTQIWVRQVPGAFSEAQCKRQVMSLPPYLTSCIMIISLKMVSNDETDRICSNCAIATKDKLSRCHTFDVL